jgi:hypothetical protein
MAISLGGAAAPAATPLAIDANNPNIRRFNVTCLDADTGPTAFNHGLLVQAGQTPVGFMIPQVTLATTVITNWFMTFTQTQVSIGKANVAGSGGAVPGTTVVAILVMWNFHSMIM